jgi:hypothetical protein
MTGDGFDQGDVGTHIEVRHSTRPNAGLIVRGKDRPGRVFVLVTGKLPAYRLCGWKGGRERPPSRVPLAGCLAGAAVGAQAG